MRNDRKRQPGQKLHPVYIYVLRLNELNDCGAGSVRDIPAKKEKRKRKTWYLGEQCFFFYISLLQDLFIFSSVSLFSLCGARLTCRGRRSWCQCGAGWRWASWWVWRGPPGLRLASATWPCPSPSPPDAMTMEAAAGCRRTSYGRCTALSPGCCRSSETPPYCPEGTKRHRRRWLSKVILSKLRWKKNLSWVGSKKNNTQYQSFTEFSTPEPPRRYFIWQN